MVLWEIAVVMKLHKSAALSTSRIRVDNTSHIGAPAPSPLTKSVHLNYIILPKTLSPNCHMLFVPSMGAEVKNWVISCRSIISANCSWGFCLSKNAISQYLVDCQVTWPSG
jgi:hypothetical protein